MHSVADTETTDLSSGDSNETNPPAPLQVVEPERTIDGARERVRRSYLDKIRPLNRQAIELRFFSGDSVSSYQMLASTLGVARESARRRVESGLIQLATLIGGGITGDEVAEALATGLKRPEQVQAENRPGPKPGFSAEKPFSMAKCKTCPRPVRSTNPTGKCRFCERAKKSSKPVATKPPPAAVAAPRPPAPAVKGLPPVETLPDDYLAAAARELKRRVQEFEARQKLLSSTLAALR